MAGRSLVFGDSTAQVQLLTRSFLVPRPGQEFPLLEPQVTHVGNGNGHATEQGRLEPLAMAGNPHHPSEHVQTHMLTLCSGVRAFRPSWVHACPPTCTLSCLLRPDHPPRLPTPDGCPVLLGSVLLQQLVQHLRLLGVVQLGGHQPLPHGHVGGHRGLRLHVQVPL